MKSGYTFIEMVFVILLVAILASIAMRKLAVTRNDAKISVMEGYISSLLKDVVDYSVSQGEVDTDFTKMSNTADSMVRRGDANKSVDLLVIKMDKIVDCIKMRIQRGSRDINLTIEKGQANGNLLCKTVQDSVDTSSYPIELIGSTIKR